MNKFLFVFLLVSSIELSCACPALPLDTVKSEIVFAENNNESAKKKPFDSCSHKKFCSLCCPMLHQIIALVISMEVLCLGIFKSQSPTPTDFQAIEQSQSSIRLRTQVLIAAGALILPYLIRYRCTKHVGSTCFGIALVSPTFFVEVPYFFYQRNYATKKL